MSTTVPVTAPQAVDPSAVPLAVRIRRWALIASPVIAGVLCTVATLADPTPGANGAEMYEAYTDGMAALQITSFSFHWAYALWVLPALLVAASVRGRGRVLANVGAVLALCGLATMPGMLMVDWIQSAIGQLYGPEAIAEVFALVEEQAWAMPFLRTPAILGLTLALPIATWPGAVAATVLLGIVAVALERATRPGSGF